jgi:valyl-tRNA synthetase
LQQVTRDITDSINIYRFDHAAQMLYEFVWNEYCDWYLELTKPVLTAPGSTPAQLRATRAGLVGVLEWVLRLAHPIMPFITEEIWQRVAPLAGKTGVTIMRQPYPQADAAAVDARALEEIAWVQNVILGVRKIRSGMNIDPRKPLPVLLQNGSARDLERLQANAIYITTLARTDGAVTWLKEGDASPDSATALVGEMKVLIPMAGLIDKAAELPRLAKEVERLGKDVERVEAKLANPSFVDKAPPAVVEKERAKLSELKSALEQLRAQQAHIAAL